MSKAIYGVTDGGTTLKCNKMYRVVDGNITQKIRKAYVVAGNFPLRGLPEGYTQVEYIEATGTQYIDTGFTPNNLSACEAVMSFTAISSVNCGLYGAAGSSHKVTAFETYYNGTFVNVGFGDTQLRPNCTIAVGDIITVRHSQSKREVLVNGEVITTDTPAAASFTAPCTLAIHALDRAGTVGYMSSSRMYEFRLWDNGTLVRDYVPCINPSGEVGLYDMVTAAFFGNAGTGTFIAGDTFREITRLFFKWEGEGSISVSPASITIAGAKNTSGTATLTYEGNGAITAKSSNTGVCTVSVSGNTIYLKLVNRGTAKITITMAATDDYTGASCTLSVTCKWTVPLSTAFAPIGASVGSYAVFAGGNLPNGTKTALANAFNTSLTRSTPTALSSARSFPGGASIGDYALFPGGLTDARVTTVDAYNASLTRSNPADLSIARSDPAAANVGDYVLIVGPDNKTTVDVYNKSLTHTTTELSTSLIRDVGASNGTYALFTGGLGNGGAYLGTVNAFDASLTRSIPTALATGRQQAAGARAGNNALFAGGMGQTTTYLSSVEVYNASLTRSTATALSAARIEAVATTVNNCAFFAGGYRSSNPLDTVDMYNSSLTRTIKTPLAAARQCAGAASVGNYALFSGTYTQAHNFVDVFTA